MMIPSLTFAMSELQVKLNEFWSKLQQSRTLTFVSILKLCLVLNGLTLSLSIEQFVTEKGKLIGG